MPRILSLLVIALGGFIIFKIRYRMINLLFSNRFFRKTVIALLMSIPSVRNRMIRIVFSPSAH